MQSILIIVSCITLNALHSLTISDHRAPLTLPRPMPEPREVVLLPLVLPLVLPLALGIPRPLVALPLAAGTRELGAACAVNLLAGLVDPGGFSIKLVSVVLILLSAVRPRQEMYTHTYRKVASISRPRPPPVTTCPGPCACGCGCPVPYP